MIEYQEITDLEKTIGTGFKEEYTDVFVVGYGLDYKGLGRNLLSAYQLAPDRA